MSEKPWKPKPRIEAMSLSEWQRLTNLRWAAENNEEHLGIHQVSILTEIPYGKRNMTLLYKDEAEAAILRINNGRTNGRYVHSTRTSNLSNGTDGPTAHAIHAGMTPKEIADLSRAFNAHRAEVDSRLDAVESRLDAVESRLDILDKELTTFLSQLSKLTQAGK